MGTTAGGCCRKCFLYPSELRLLGGFLAFFAGVLLLAFGMSYLKPFLETRDFREATCTVTSIAIPDPDQYTKCRCFDDDKKCDRGYPNNYMSNKRYMSPADRRSRITYPVPGKTGDNLSEDGACYSRCETGACYSCFPCVEILVDYTSDEDEVQKTDARLYKSKDIIYENFDGLKCFHLSCTDVILDNEYYIAEAIRRYSVVGSRFKCFYNRIEQDFVIVEKVEFEQVFHCMFWPSLFFLVGFLMIVASFFVQRKLDIREKQAEAKTKLIDALSQDPSKMSGSFPGIESGRETPPRRLSRHYSNPNIPLSDSARTSQMFAHAQARSAVAPRRAEPRPNAGQRQRKVSVINLSTPTPRGGQQNIAFLVTDRAGTELAFPDTLPRGATVAHGGQRRASAARPGPDSPITKFSLHRGASLESLASLRSEGLYPANFNPPSIMKNSASVPNNQENRTKRVVRLSEGPVLDSDTDTDTPGSLPAPDTKPPTPDQGESAETSDKLETNEVNAVADVHGDLNYDVQHQMENIRL